MNFVEDVWNVETKSNVDFSTEYSVVGVKKKA